MMVEPGPREIDLIVERFYVFESGALFLGNRTDFLKEYGALSMAERLFVLRGTSALSRKQRTSFFEALRDIALLRSHRLQARVSSGYESNT
ncbi:LOW QUALITY PROTEIN: hypothetical protein ACER0C_003478 [Sarotherodon galilaeus]